MESEFEEVLEHNSLEIHNDENGLIMKNNDKNNIYKRTEELFSNLKSYFDNPNDKLTSSNLHFHYVNQVPELFLLCFAGDSLICEDQQDVNKKIKHENLQAGELCLKILLLYLENPQTIDISKLIIRTSFMVLHQAYTHFKDCESFYGELFEEFTMELGNFYNQVQEVQKVVLVRLDEIINSDSYNTEKEVAEIVLISNYIGKLWELVASLDRMTGFVLWKTFTKLILKYKYILQKELEIDDYLLPLVLYIKDAIVQCSYNIEMKEQVDESDVKMTIVELSAIKKIVEVFKGCLKENIIQHMRHLALQFYNLLILSHSCKTDGEKDISVIKILLKTAKRVVLHFFSDNMFFTSAFHSTLKEVTDDLQLPLVLLKLGGINYLKDNSAILLEHGHLLQNGEVINQLLSTLKANKPEDDLKLISLKLPATLIREEIKENAEVVSLYQHCYICLSECCTLLSSSPDTINALENHWLSIYKSSSDVISLLVADVWIYYARCGSVENMLKRCTTLSENLTTVKFDSRIENLLMRMIKFLPTEYKIRLFENQKHVYHMYCNHKIVHRFSSPQLTNYQPVDNILDEKINMLLADLNYSKSDDTEKLIQRACNILELCTVCVNKLTPTELLKVIEFCDALFLSGIYDIQIATVTFLKVFNGRTLSNNAKEIDALTSAIANLLCATMSSKNYILRFEAFNVYFSLAQSTPHSEMLKKTVIKCPSLVPFIKSYAEKVPLLEFLKEDVKHDMFQKQLIKYHSIGTNTQPLSEDKKQMLFSLLT